MRVRVLRDADLPTHRLTKGAVMFVDSRYASEWIKAGIVELCEPETTSAPPEREIASGPTRKSRRKAVAE